MSRASTKSNNLHSLQKLILLYLAENEPTTINGANEKLGKSYKPTHTAFKSLEKKKLIKKIRIWKYREQPFSQYWLTDGGIILAILEGANQEKLSYQAKQLRPNDKPLEIFLEIARYIDPQIIEMTHSSVIEKKSLDIMDILNILFLQAPSEMSLENLQKLTTALKKYPEEYNQLKVAKEIIINQLNQIIPD